MCLCWLDGVTEAETIVVTDRADLVPEAAPPQDRDKLEALQFRGNYMFNQIFFFPSLPSSRKCPPGFLLPRLKGWMFQGLIFNTSSQGSSRLWLGMEEMPWQGWTRLKTWETNRDQWDCRGFCAFPMQLEVVLRWMRLDVSLFSQVCCSPPGWCQCWR